MDGGRVWRGTAVAVLSAVLTAVGHLAGGGTVPDLGVMVVLVPLLAVAFTSLAEASRGPVGTLATLAAGQLVLHETMTVLHDGHTQGPVLVDGLRMFLLHAAVTLVTAVALRYADAAICALTRALDRVLPRRLSPPPALRPLRVHPVPAADVPARLALILSAATSRRGPPVGC